MIGITIVLLIKQPNHMGKANIYYHDIGDYLDREQKLKIISDFKSIKEISFQEIKPNQYGDWVNQRSENFIRFVPIEAKKKFLETAHSFFSAHSIGVGTKRDSWVYNFSEHELTTNVNETIDFYNKEIDRYNQKENINLKAKDFIDKNPKKISWSKEVVDTFIKGKKFDFDINSIITSHYRPFCKQKLYFNRSDLKCKAIIQKQPFVPTQNLIKSNKLLPPNI